MTLSAAQRAEFDDRARALGHDPARLARGGEVMVSHFTIPSLADGRFFCTATDEQRSSRLAGFFHPAIAARRRLGQGMHDRGEAAIFAGAPVEDADERDLKNHLPFHVKGVSVQQHCVPAGQTWDVSVRGDVWGLDEREELYVAVNVGTLVLAPGAAVIVRGNVFSLLCQSLICAPGSDAAGYPYRIGILPTPFSVDRRSGPLHGSPGAGGLSGRAGADALPIPTWPSVLGPRLAPGSGAIDLDGADGADGEPGLAGLPGRNGGMAKLAELTIRKLDGRLIVFAQAGAGGAGGSGGSGGSGGAGGRGSNGARLVRGLVPGGAGGAAGRGGAGGAGGRGGHGGISSNVYVEVLPGCEGQVELCALPAPGGPGGAGGGGGRGGAPGAGGASPNGLADGMNGCPGEGGVAGEPGPPGRSRPAPALFLNGVRQLPIS